MLEPTDLFLPTRLQTLAALDAVQGCVPAAAKLVARLTLRERADGSAPVEALLFRNGTRWLLRWPNGGGVDLDEDLERRIDAFVSSRRKGRGGVGRGQGRKSADGAAYPKQYGVSLSDLDVEMLAALGGENVSAGARVLARGLQPEDAVKISRFSGRVDDDTFKVNVRLDDASAAALRSHGGGSVGKGLRALLAAARAPLAHQP